VTFVAGQTIEKDWKRFRVSQVGLRIRNVQATDSGTYYCQAVNGYGAKHVQVLLVVKGKAFMYAACHFIKNDISLSF